MSNFAYIWFDTNFIPYYVGKGIVYSRGRSRDFANHGRIGVPPPSERILRFDCSCKEEALALESWLIKRIGRRDLGTGPLMNLTDGGAGTRNPAETIRQVYRANGRSNVESGLLKSISAMGGHAGAGRKNTASAGRRESGFRICHVRWHIDRNIVKAGCSFCAAGEEDSACQ